MEVPKLDLEFLHPNVVPQSSYKPRALPLKPGRKHFSNKDKEFSIESFTSRVPSKRHEIAHQFDKRVTARDDMPIQTNRLIGVNEGGGMKQKNVYVKVSNSVLNPYGNDFVSINITDIAPVGDFQCCDVNNVKISSTNDVVEHDDLLMDVVNINQYNYADINTTIPPSTPLEPVKIDLGNTGVFDDLRIPNHVIEKLIVSNLDTGSIYTDKQKDLLSKTRYTLQQFEEDEKYRIYLNTLIYHSSEHIDLDAVQQAANGVKSDDKNPPPPTNPSVLTTRRLIGNKKEAVKDNKPLKSNLRSLPPASVSSVDTTGLYYVSSLDVASDEVPVTKKGIEPIVAKPIHPTQPPRSTKLHRSTEPSKPQGSTDNSDRIVSPPRVQVKSPTNMHVSHPIVDVKITSKNEDSGAQVNDPLLLTDIYNNTYLTEYEMRELNNEKNFMNNIFYTGVLKSKVSTSDAGKKGKSKAVYNNGFDDRKGYYNVAVGDHINYRYEIKKLIGKGKHSKVYIAVDHKYSGNKRVVLKILRNKPQMDAKISAELFNLRTVLARVDRTEVDAPTASDMPTYHNIIQLKDYFKFRSHNILAFPFVGHITLSEYLSTVNHAGCNIRYVRAIGIQLLDALAFLREKSIIHADLNPSNIVIADIGNISLVKIVLVDFGSSIRNDSKDPSRNTTLDIIQQTSPNRAYIAPEILIGLPYSHGMDMWGLGCILAELRLGTPIFLGETNHDQLLAIVECLGDMDKSFSLTIPPDISNLILHSETNQLLIYPSPVKGILRHPGSKSMESYFQHKLMQHEMHEDRMLVAYLKSIFKYDPKDRLSPMQSTTKDFFNLRIEGVIASLSMR